MMDGGAMESVEAEIQDEVQDEDGIEDEGEEGVVQAQANSAPTGSTGSTDAEEEVEEPIPEQKFQIRQKVYARDDKASGILYESIVRRAMYGLRQRQINVYLVNPDDPNAGKIEQDEDEQEEYCWHYFVHYQGWNVKWDRWVEEGSLYVASDASAELAKLLKKELDKIVKLQKAGAGVGRGGNDINIIRRRMAQLEAEFREEERRAELRREGLLPPLSKEQEKEKREENEKDGGVDHGHSDNADEEDSNMNTGSNDDAKTDKSGDNKDDEKKIIKIADTDDEPLKKKYPKAVIEKEKRLRRKRLEGKLWRKQSHAQKIVLPFTLKKVMVEEWEIINLGMVPRLPSVVPVRSVLKKFLEQKMEMLRPQKQSEEASEVGAPNRDRDSAVDANANVGANATEAEAAEIQAMENAEFDALAEDEETANKKKEWVDMVNGVAQFFDEALSVHLLYEHERIHHRIIMRSDDPVLEGRLPSEIYGCEYLLRMFVQFPTLLAESGVPESDSRTILSKMNDLLRFVQKHQSEFFSQSYRKPGDNELKKRRKSLKKRKESTAENTNLSEQAVAAHPEKKRNMNSSSLTESREVVCPLPF